jgi:hypothetical protein
MGRDPIPPVEIEQLRLRAQLAESIGIGSLAQEIGKQPRVEGRAGQAIRDDEAAATDELPKRPPARSAQARKSTRAAEAAQPRAGSKQANVIALLSRPQGATIAPS